MQNCKKDRSIDTVIVSYDFEGHTISDRSLIEQKLKRDHQVLDGKNIYSISWGNISKSVRISESLYLNFLHARIGRMRIFYDFISIIIIPWTLWKNHIHPKQIIIYDFPFIWTALATSFVVGGDVVLQLNNLPVDLAKTRGVFQRIYHKIHEVLGSNAPKYYFVINETTKKYVEKLGVSSKKINVFTPDTISYYRSSIKKIEKGIIKKELEIPVGEPMILSVGRLEAEKGFEELIDIFVQISIRAWLVIIGDGSLRKKLEEKASSYPSARILFLGNKNHEEIWNYYADADVFVLLSKSEALGLVFWEAMYMGVPVIGRPIGGIKESIGEDESRGWFWDTKDGPEAFKDLVVHCIERRKEVREKIERGSVYVSQRLSIKGR